MKPILWPADPDDWFIEFRQFLWWRFPDYREARWLAKTKLIDPRAFPEHYGHAKGRRPGAWDHPEYVYATFAPDLFRSWLRKTNYANSIRNDKEGAFLIEKAYKYLEDEARKRWWDGEWGEIGLLQMAEWCDYEAKYAWFAWLSNPWKEKRSHIHFTEERREEFTKRQRLIILHRDKYRCQLCGTDATKGSTLHVDHVIPKSRGGKAVPWNLWALCEECNLGKLDYILR